MVVHDDSIRVPWFLGNSDEFIYMRGFTIPCIVNIPSDGRKCIHTIPDRFPGHTIEVEGLDSSGENLVINHWTWDQGYAGGLCFYNLQTGGMNCPTEGLPVLNGRTVTEYTFSPDNNYIAFTYENSTPTSDAAGSTSGVAVIDVNGKHYNDLGISNAPHWGGIYMVSTWRPLPVNP